VSHVNNTATAIGSLSGSGAESGAPKEPSGDLPVKPDRPAQPQPSAAPAPVDATEPKPEAPTPEAKSAAIDAEKVVPVPGRRVFRVSGASFLRNRPTANADIVDTLHPGMSVEVTALGGEFLRVRSLEGEKFQGFVHKEDAFFEPVR